METNDTQAPPLRYLIDGHGRVVGALEEVAEGCFVLGAADGPLPHDMERATGTVDLDHLERLAMEATLGACTVVAHTWPAAYFDNNTSESVQKFWRPVAHLYEDDPNTPVAVGYNLVHEHGYSLRGIDGDMFERRADAEFHAALSPEVVLALLQEARAARAIGAAGREGAKAAVLRAAPEDGEWTPQAAQSIAAVWTAAQAHAWALTFTQSPTAGGRLLADAYQALRDELVMRSGLYESVESAVEEFGPLLYTKVGCAFCTWTTEVLSAEVTDTLRAHVMECPNHPMRELERRLAEHPGA